MKEYDFIFSLGFSCGCTQAMRMAALQFASYPLDWLGTPSLDNSVKVLESGFESWMDYDDMRLVDVSHGAGFCTRIYLNEKTKLGYSHEFSDFDRFENTYPGVSSTYARRVDRFLELFRSRKRILAVYLEHTTREDRVLDDELVSIRNRLAAIAPQAEIDLLYFYEDVEHPVPAVISSASGVTVVAADYQMKENGEVTQFVNLPVIAGFLQNNVSVMDSRTEAEKEKFAGEMKKMHSGRWGYDKSAFRRWLNQRAYKLYRSLEKVLQRKGLVHAPRSIWFWDSPTPWKDGSE